MRKNKFNKLKWQMQRERHHIDREEPIPSEVSIGISDVIPDVMKKIGLEKPFWENELIEKWNELVGPQLAAHTRPGRLDRKILYVYVNHPGWLNELARYGQKEILKKLQDYFGANKIKNVRLQLDPDRT